MAVMNGLVTGIIAGVAVGAAAGILLAPKPGKVTRRYAVARAFRFRQQAGGYLSRRLKRGHAALPVTNVE